MRRDSEFVLTPALIILRVQTIEKPSSKPRGWKAFVQRFQPEGLAEIGRLAQATGLAGNINVEPRQGLGREHRIVIPTPLRGLCSFHFTPVARATG